MADEIALMRDGRIVQQGAPYEIYNGPVDRDTASFFSDINVVRGEVQGDLAQTAFGTFPSDGVGEAGGADIVIRPQHVGIDFDRDGHGPEPTSERGTAAKGVVQRARFMGGESLVEFRLEHDGGMVKATVPGVFLPKPGREMWLTLRRDRCFVFPAE